MPFLLLGSWCLELEPIYAAVRLVWGLLLLWLPSANLGFRFLYFIFYLGQRLVRRRYFTLYFCSWLPCIPVPYMWFPLLFYSIIWQTAVAPWPVFAHLMGKARLLFIIIWCQCYVGSYMPGSLWCSFLGYPFLSKTTSYVLYVWWILKGEDALPLPSRWEPYNVG